MSEAPRVTILMPVYNGQRYLDEAIASVVGQDYADFEFVIIDDGSTDETAAILAKWAARDPRIVIHRSPGNEGIPSALNRGLAVARGEYIGRQDADDLCLPRRLAGQVAVLDQQPGVELVSAGYELIESDGRRRHVMRRYEAPEVIEYLLHFSNFIGGHGQVMFRRATVAELGNYSVEYPSSQDYELWSRVIRRGRCVVLPMIGMRHRMHEQRASVVWGQRQQNHSVAISRRNLETLLQRKLSEREVTAVAAVWRQTGQRGMASDRTCFGIESSTDDLRSVRIEAGLSCHRQETLPRPGDLDAPRIENDMASARFAVLEFRGSGLPLGGPEEEEVALIRGKLRCAERRRVTGVRYRKQLAERLRRGRDREGDEKQSSEA